MKALIFLMTAFSLGLNCRGLGDDSYSALAEKGFSLRETSLAKPTLRLSSKY